MEDDLINANFTGTYGYKKLDDTKIKWIKEFTFVSAERWNGVEKDFHFNEN